MMRAGGLALAGAALLAAGVTAGVASPGEEEPRPGPRPVPTTERAPAPRVIDGAPRSGTVAARPSPGEAARASGALSARITRATMLRDRPGGRMLVRLGRRTRFGSETVLAIAKERDGWLAVRTEKLPNGRVGWIPADAALVELQPYRLRIDLSQRRLTVLRGDRAVLRAPVAVGRPGSSTPTGRFGVTDRLRTASPSSPYGCCVLALSGRQPNVPQGWSGGDRLAIHGTSSPGSIGTAASSGCVRAGADTMRRLMATIPAGAPVTIVE